MGPVCVHESFDRGTVRGYPHSTVYVAHHQVVWDDTGVVEEATDRYLVASVFNGEWVKVTYYWNGTAYR